MVRRKGADRLFEANVHIIDCERKSWNEARTKDATRGEAIGDFVFKVRIPDCKTIDRSLIRQCGERLRNSYRGAIAGDFDNDGRVDIVVLPISGAPMLLSNRTVTRNSWIGFSLIGTHSNRDALGARMQIEGCGRKWFDTVRNGGSYLSRNDPRLHFGLGSCGTVDRAAIIWPSGKRQVLKTPATNRYTTVQEP